LSRLDELRRIVAELLKAKVTPKHSLFKTMVPHQYLKTLTETWKHYRWIPYIQGNPHLTPEEQEEWINKLTRRGIGNIAYG